MPIQRDKPSNLGEKTLKTRDPPMGARLSSEDRVVVYSASTPQVWGSINGLRKVDSAFHPRYIGSINEYQACLGLKHGRSLFRQTTKSGHLFMHLSVQ
ncbi:hypothetical protein TNCV_2988271 [Trichonephila clavipes]|nr:hypothetical protein TNCV_2988271 [Trichonephila clavipes]